MRATQREGALSGRTSQNAEGSVKSERLENLLDQLVAIQMDVAPACKASGTGSSVLVARDLLLNIGDILDLAIAEIRTIIQEVDGSNPEYTPSPSRET
jgi:hypothetical protein